MRAKFTISFISILFFTANLFGQLKSPDDFLPHQLGEFFTPHHLLVDYFEHVAANSKQIQLKQYGKTNQDRPLIWAVISSPKNMERIEEIRENNLKTTGMLEGNSNLKNAPAIVWLSFGVHGNEAGASESAMATLYALTNPQDKAVQKWLENTVVIVDPCINPDGYSRYTHWNRNATNSSPNPHPESREHHEPWPGGRVNHYLFDLNRDWAWQTQVETQQRIVIYKQWMPHIHVDFHEMFHNDPYYFAPAAQPFHQYINDWQSDFQFQIGQNNAKHFDENNWTYFTREIFDLFYPSYGDTYPTFNGAIGMTYEQGGHSMAGRAILMENGDTLTLYDRISHHKTTALSTVEVSSNNADKLNEHFADYFQNSKNNPKGKYKSFVIKKSNSLGKVKALCELLDRNQIKYGQASASKSLSGFNYATGKNQSVKIEEGDLVIDAHQPMSVLTQVLFEPEPYLPDSLTYDITAWALPYAYGLEAYAFTEKLSGGKAYEFPVYELPKNKTPYAYVIPWESLNSARFVGELLQAGVTPRYASVGFEVEGRSYSPGTVLVLKADNRKYKNGLDETVRTIASDLNHELQSTSTGFVSKGKDFGSDKMRLIKPTNVAILSGDNINANGFGQAWHLFDKELSFPLTVLNAKDIKNDLRDYEVIIMPEGRYGLDSISLAKLSEWVRAGGRLIAIGSAVHSFSGKKGFALKRKAKPKSAKGKPNPKANLKTYGDRERRYIANAMPGAIFKLEMDFTHPLAFGLKNNYYSLKTSRSTFGYLENSWNVGYLGDDPFFQGFAGSQIKHKLANTAVFSVQEMGRGSIVYMVDNPLFRSFWYNGKCLFANAIFFR